MAIFRKKVSNKDTSLKEKYHQFQKLLVNNENAHNSMSILSEMIKSKRPFSSGYALKNLDELMVSTEKMVNDLIELAGPSYKVLIEKLNSIRLISSTALVPRIKPVHDIDFSDKESIYNQISIHRDEDLQHFYNLSQITEKNIHQVGNKMARLGEIKNVLNIPVPDGFCLSFLLFDDIIRSNNLKQKLNDLFFNLDYSNQEKVKYACHQAQALIISSDIPLYLEKIILQSFDNTFPKQDITVAVRSSAFGEDSEQFSFAGLHLTLLNVKREYIVDSVLKVLISLYSPQSVTYRYLSGIRDEDMPMSVGCLQMVDSRTAGVLFTQDPFGKQEGMIVQSTWGLGSQVVDGTIKPQEYIIKQENQQLLIIRSDKSDSASQEPNLNINELRLLFDYAQKIVKHFGSAQDIEWAVGKDGIVYILQSRKLKVYEDTPQVSINIGDIIQNTKAEVLINQGECSAAGISSGQVYKVRTIQDINRIKEGQIVVARSHIIELTSVIHLISGLITEVGSSTSHLSIIAREMNLPFLSNVDNALDKLQEGTEITLIAHEKKVIKGNLLPELNKHGFLDKKYGHYENSPLYLIWSALTSYLFHLNLTDAESPEFNIHNCQSLHDIIRFTHEQSMRSMFSIHNTTNLNQIKARKLTFNVPIDLYVIDIGGGLKNEESNNITIEEVLSTPFNALIKGMTTKGLSWTGYVFVDTKGMTEMFMNNLAGNNAPNTYTNMKSYAIISDKYLNFFSQLGYHFTRLDALVSNRINKNYINFTFRGGAANSLKKQRRLQAIAGILNHYGFTTTIYEDNVKATIRNISKSDVLNLLTMTGKLMGAVRNADAVMLSDAHIEIFIKSFISGELMPALKLPN